MSENIHEAAFDCAVTGYNTVAKVVLLVHAEVGAAVGYKHVEFFEAAFVEQHLDSFAGCVFAFSVLLFDCFGAATKASFFAFRNQFLDFFDLTTHFLY